MTRTDVALNIVEIRKPEIDAKLVAENVAQQLVRRVAFRGAMKRAVQRAMRLGAPGTRVNCGVTLGRGQEARSEWCRHGWVAPPSTRPREATRPGRDTTTLTNRLVEGCGTN